MAVKPVEDCEEEAMEAECEFGARKAEMMRSGAEVQEHCFRVPRFGRKKNVAVAAHKVFLEEELRPLLDEPEEALLRSQGPLASVSFTSLPTLRETTFAPQPFRLLILRRMRLAIPLSAGVAVHSIAVVTTGLRVRGRES